MDNIIECIKREQDDQITHDDDTSFPIRDGSHTNLNETDKINSTIESQTQTNESLTKHVSMNQDPECIESVPLLKRIATKGKASLKYWIKNKEDVDNQDRSLAFIMMGYVMVFLICHFPRLLLNLYELATIRYDNKDSDIIIKSLYEFFINSKLIIFFTNFKKCYGMRKESNGTVSIVEQHYGSLFPSYAW